jgi:hypothetical protein
LSSLRRDGLNPGSVTGLDASAEGWREFSADWEEFRAEAEECRDLDEERVLVLHLFGGRGKRSGHIGARLRCRGGL